MAEFVGVKFSTCTTRDPVILPHPGETILPKLIHYEARSIWQVLDRNARNNSKGSEGMREKQLLSFMFGEKCFEVAALNHGRPEAFKGSQAVKGNILQVV